MKPSEFVYWLKGYLAARAESGATAKDVETILAECSKVSDVTMPTQPLNPPFPHYPPGIRGWPVTCGVTKL